jgi:hypothetical protein
VRAERKKRCSAFLETLVAKRSEFFVSWLAGSQKGAGDVSFWWALSTHTVVVGGRRGFFGWAYQKAQHNK